MNKRSKMVEREILEAIAYREDILFKDAPDAEWRSDRIFRRILRGIAFQYGMNQDHVWAKAENLEDKYVMVSNRVVDAE